MNEKRLYNKIRNDIWSEERGTVTTVLARFGTGGTNTPIVVEITDEENDQTLQPDQARPVG